jgi:hypothetical protein
MKILTNLPVDELTVTDLLMRAAVLYQDSNFSVCLEMAWTATEHLVDRLWTSFIEANRSREVSGKTVPFINADRRTRLEGRDYSASVVIEILSLEDLIPWNLYGDLTRVRIARNKWLHSMQIVDSETASLAMWTAERMLAQVEGIELYIPLNSSTSL